ncbi:hypothetical protein J6590_058414 [Homalodisca vitripennis]|nr:hypothetical protein J6590_058414 [Homalodisca vitripennis]
MDETGESARIGDVSGTSSGYERSPTFKRQSKTSPYGPDRQGPGRKVETLALAFKQESERIATPPPEAISCW